jgi:hypothetical protein
MRRGGEGPVLEPVPTVTRVKSGQPVRGRQVGLFVAVVGGVVLVGLHSPTILAAGFSVAVCRGMGVFARCGVMAATRLQGIV